MKRRTWCGAICLVALLALVAEPAGAGTMPNGLMPNGLMPNGLMPNGLMPNGLMPNGLMPNGLMPNGLMPNGLMPNGLMPNGLMPNGLMSYSIYGDMFAVVNGTNVTFAEWFAIDPAARSDFMKYFVRCAYGPGVEVTYQSDTPAPDDVSSQEEYAEGDGEKCDRHRDDSEGRDHPTYRWQGYFGLAQTSLDAKVQMTNDEAKWISSCMLAFVNTKGTHQYLSLGMAGKTAPSEAASRALTISAGEAWTVGQPFGWFFGDLTAPDPTKYACDVTLGNYYFRNIETILGRTCDISRCSYVDPAGQTQYILSDFLGLCGPKFQMSGSTGNPGADQLQWNGITYHPIAVHGPTLGDFESAAPLEYSSQLFAGLRMVDVASCKGDPSAQPPLAAWCTPTEAHFDKKLVYWRVGDPTDPWPPPGMQRIECPNLECLGNHIEAPGAKAQIPGSGKLVGLVDGQAVDAIRVAPPDLDPSALGEAYTAIIRYTKGRTGTANIWASTASGGWRDATTFGDGPGPDVWKSTGTSEQFEWMQVYPVYPGPDSATSGGAPALKVRVSGALMSESCTGLELFKGANEQGYCDKVFPTNPPRNNTVCPKEFERAPACLGQLAWHKKHGTWGWYCRGGGEALYACTAADAPELDAAGFVIGKPWCMPEGATSFVGVCK